MEDYQWNNSNKQQIPTK